MSVRQLSVLGVGCACALAMAGDLNPPAGPVSPTMLELNKIEPRVVLNDLPGDPTSVHLITAPGNYVLTADLIVPAGKSGIVVALPMGLDGRVSIDPNGFSVIGLPGSGNGLQVNGTPGAGTYKLCYTVNNGSTWTQMGGSGVVVNGGRVVEICGIDIQDCGGDGVTVTDATEATIDVSVRDCFGNGISATNVTKLVATPTTRIAFAPTGQCAAPNRIVGVGGHGFYSRDCDDVDISGFRISDTGLDGVRFEHSLPAVQARLGVANGGIERAGLHGIAVIAGPSLTDVRVASTWAHDAIGSGLYIEDAVGVEVHDWEDKDCDGDGLTVLGTSLNAKFSHISTTVSRSAGGGGVVVSDNPGAASSVVIQDAKVERAGFIGVSCKAKNVEVTRVAVSAGGVTASGIEVECENGALRDLSATGAQGAGVVLRVDGSLLVDGVASTNNGGEGLICAKGSGSGVGKAAFKEFRVRFNGVAAPGGADGAIFLNLGGLELRDGDSSFNTGSGIRVLDLTGDALMDFVACTANGLNGVSVEAPSGVSAGRYVLRSGTIGSNGGAGVFLEATTGGQIVDCTVSNNGGIGLHVLGSGHVVHRNSLLSNSGGPMLVLGGNVVGPLVDELTIPANSNPAANYVH